MKWIKYHFCPDGEESPMDKMLSYSEANEEIAKREALNGEYTIEDDGQQDPDESGSDTVTWDELAAAYSEGVQSA